jgi:hypothetical protein
VLPNTRLLSVQASLTGHNSQTPHLTGRKSDNTVFYRFCLFIL